MTIAQTAQRFGVGASTAARRLKCPERKSDARTKFRKLDPARLIADVEVYPDAYQSERAERLGACRNAIFRFLKKLNMTYKKALRHPKADADKRRSFRDIAKY